MASGLDHKPISYINSLTVLENGVQPHLHGIVNNPTSSSSSSEGDDDSMDQIFSKSCDYSDNHSNTIRFAPTVSRSLSEDVLQKPNYYRRISVASTKGRLIGCPRLKPGEKIIRSVSIGIQIPGKLPEEGSTVLLQPKKKSRFTTQQKMVAFCLCLVDFTSFLSMSIIAPFFPGEAASKGMREAVSGFVFSIYALVVMLTSPLFGKMIPYVGARYMFLSGVLCAGVCNILFGLLDQVTGTTEFAVLCFVVRSFEAIGAAAFSTASCTILIDQFPDDIGTVFGFTETCLGLGMSIGPAIGGALYSVGGFGVPFFTLGGFVLLTVPVCWSLMRSMEEPAICVNSNVSYTKLLGNPHVIIVCLILVVASQAQGFIDPTLEPHMREYDLSAGIIGLLFLLLSASYAISSPIVGWVSSKCENKYPVMIVGLSLITVSMLLIGPSKIIPINGSVGLSIAALILLGMSFAAASVPTFESIFIAAINGGLEDDITTYSIVSGLWNSMYSLGEVTGPSLGGVLSDFLEFSQASSVMALCSAIAFAVAMIAWINPCMCFGRLSLVDMDNDDDDDDSTEKEKDNTPDSQATEENSVLVKSSQNYGTVYSNEVNPVV